METPLPLPSPPMNAARSPREPAGVVPPAGEGEGATAPGFFADDARRRTSPAPPPSYTATFSVVPPAPFVLPPPPISPPSPPRDEGWATPGTTRRSAPRGTKVRPRTPRASRRRRGVAPDGRVGRVTIAVACNPWHLTRTITAPGVVVEMVAPWGRGPPRITPGAISVVGGDTSGADLARVFSRRRTYRRRNPSNRHHPKRKMNRHHHRCPRRPRCPPPRTASVSRRL